jgi:tannase
MGLASWAVITAACITAAQATTLNEVCRPSHVQSSLPSDSLINGIVIDSSSVTANPVTNASVHGDSNIPDAVFDYCNVTFAYSHSGANDRVNVWYWIPAPGAFQNRYLSTGGGGYAINSGSSSLPGGVTYGAVAGATDGGFGSFSTNFDRVWPLENGTANWNALYMFGYEAIHELSVIGKEFTKQFFDMGNTKLYSYYQGCSEGGRDGWSQIQRYGDELDGAITGAPAFRFSHQQVQHLWSNVVEQNLDYYPPPCELDKIVDEIITACDPLDGKIDGVVARTDLCKLHFDLSKIIGKPYSCAAAPASRFSPATPAQNGTVSAKGIAVAKESINGVRDSQGRQVYLSYQPSATFDDAQTQYNSKTGSWELSVNGIGAEFVSRYLEMVDSSSLANLDGVTGDTLKDWIIEGWKKYEDSLQTTWPDLTPFQDAGGKILHFHGESDFSIPTASSIRYHESVREIMYPNLNFKDGNTALNEWYRLFLVPGAGHCSPSATQPNGPFPQTNLAVLIDWVEKDIAPATLNATILQGDHVGENQQICLWPLRPLWTQNGTKMGCEYNQASINSWLYDFDAFKMPVY